MTDTADHDLGIFRPHPVNEPLIFVEEPAFAQLSVLHAIDQHTPNATWGFTEIFDHNESSERVADEYILDGDQLPESPSGSLAECDERCLAAPVGSGERALTHVVQLDVFVIRSQNVLEIRREPSICITAKHALCLVSPGHVTTVGVACDIFQELLRRFARDFSNLRTTWSYDSLNIGRIDAKVSSDGFNTCTQPIHA
jgi:hypothetical protein